MSIDLEIISNGYGDPYALEFELSMNLGVIIHRIDLKTYLSYFEDNLTVECSLTEAVTQDYHVALRPQAGL